MVNKLSLIFKCWITFSWINTIETSKFRTTEKKYAKFCLGIVCLVFVVLISLLFLFIFLLKDNCFTEFCFLSNLNFFFFLKKLKMLYLLVEENALVCCEEFVVVQAYCGSKITKNNVS